MLRIASTCTSRDAFVAVFGRYCDGEFIFVATRSHRQSGEELSFRITLASGEILIAATGRVEACYRDGEGPYGRAGLLLRFYDVDPGSRALVLELAAVPNAGFSRRDERVGSDPGEVDSETRPAGLPRAVAHRASAARISSSQVAVPRPPPLAVKPDATPPPVLLEHATTRAGDDEGPTGVKSMESLVSRPDRGAGQSRDFDDELGWDERSDVFGEGRRGRMVLRADPSGPHESGESSQESSAEQDPSLEPPVECAVFEESGPAEPSPPAQDPVGLPAAIRARASRPHDVWDDETIPPWLRGPQPDDDLDMPTGTHEPDRLAQRIADEVTEPAKPRDRQADEAVRAGAVSRPLERDRLPPVSGELDPGYGRTETYDVGAMIPRRRWPLALVAAAVSGVIGLVAGYAIGAGVDPSSGDSDAGAADVTSTSAKTIAAGNELGEAHPDESGASGEITVAIDEDSEDSGEPADQAEAEPDGGRRARERSPADERRSRRAVERALRRDGCAVDVRSDPDGADIMVAGQVMGSTPTRFELPCGSHEIEVRRSRYAEAVKRVRLRPGKLDKVDVRLSRPDHKLRIVTAPVGATVTVNGKQVGTTPVIATVKGYQHIRVRIERPGFAPWSRKLYAREPLTRLTVKLSPEQGSAPPTSGPAGSQAQTPPAAAPASPTPSLSSPGSEAKGP